MRNVKMWRTRLRPLISSLVLFGLGVTTCLMFVQMSQNGLDGPAVYTNSQEYQSPQQLQQTQQEAPCDSAPASASGNVITSIEAADKKRRRVNSIIGGDANNEGGSDRKTIKNYPNHKNIPGGGRNPEIGGGKYLAEAVIADSSIMKIDTVNPSSDVNRGVFIKSSQSETLNDIYSNDENDINDDNGPTVWVITPTFYRPEQKPELTRLAQALLPLKNFVHWILVEDISHGSELSFKELEIFISTRFSMIKHTILKSIPPKSTTKIVGRPRGVGGRRAAIDWLRKHFEHKKSTAEGVVYFADDDNTYDSDIFRQMQGTKKVSMFPVGLVTDFGVSSPIVQNGKVVGFYDGWSGLRKFPVDMAGFAINIQLFLDKPDANMPWVAGYEEDELLKSLGITMKDIRPLANNCTEILVWHTKAIRHTWPKRPKSMKPGLLTSTNLLQLLKSLPQKSLAGLGANSNKAGTGFSFLNMIFGGLQ